MPNLLPIDALLIAAGAWLGTGLAGLAAPRDTRFVAKTLFPLGALVGLAVGVVALAALAVLALTAVFYHSSRMPASRACCSCAPARCCTRRTSAASASSAA